MPRPNLLGDRRIAWDVRKLDVAVDRLPVESETTDADASWSDIDAT